MFLVLKTLWYSNEHVQKLLKLTAATVWLSLGLEIINLVQLNQATF